LRAVKGDFHEGHDRWTGDEDVAAARGAPSNGLKTRAADGSRLLGEKMMGKIAVRFRRTASGRGRIVVEAARTGRSSWRASEASRHREVLNDHWLGAR
jgi:hypothetical protein